MLARTRGTLVATAVATFVSAASAEPVYQGGWVYLGASGGYSFIDVDEGEISGVARDQGFATAQTSLDDTDVGWKVFGGYRINKHFAVEGTYVDFGEAKFTTRTTGPNGVVDGKGEATAYALDVLGIARPTEWAELMVRVGGFRWEVDAKQAAVIDGEASSVHVDERGTDFKAGFGVSLLVSEDVSLRLEAEGYFNVGDDNTTGEADIGFLSIGLSYGF